LTPPSSSGESALDPSIMIIKDDFNMDNVENNKE